MHTNLQCARDDMECRLCGKPLKIGARHNWVEFTTDNKPVPVAEAGPDNTQGFFTVGNECVRRIPFDCRHPKMTAEDFDTYIDSL